MSWFFSRNKDDINIRKPGDAVYLEGRTMIQISEPADWGWLYQENDDNTGESYTVVIKKDGENWSIVHKERAGGIDDITDIQATIVDVDEKSELILKVTAKIKIKKGERSYYTDAKAFKRISITRFNQLKDQMKDQKDQGKTINYNDAKLIDGTGYNPSVFLFMLGATSNGKSCWINALSNPGAIERLSRHNIINLNPLGIDPVLLLKPTDPLSIPPFKNFFLNRGERERCPEVDIYIVDLGGEISNIKSDDEKQELIRRTIRPHAAGIFVVRNEKWLLENETTDSDPLNLIRELNRDRKLKNKFCYILTCADRLKEVLESREHYTALKEILKKINEETEPSEAFVKELKSALALPKIQQALENKAQHENIKQADIGLILDGLNKNFISGKFAEELKKAENLDLYKTLEKFKEALEKDENDIKIALERIINKLVFARIEELLLKTYSGQKAELDDAKKALKSLKEASKSLKEVIALKNLVEVLDSLKEVFDDVLKLKDIIPEALKRLDKVLDSYANHPNLTSQSPIFKQTSCVPSDLQEMWQNCAIASNIMKKDPLVGDSPCFVVSCCSDIKDDTGQIIGSAQNQYNTELPLIYMVYRLLKI